MYTSIKMNGRNVETVEIETPLGTVHVTLIPDSAFEDMKVSATLISKTTSGAGIEVEHHKIKKANSGIFIYPKRTNFSMSLFVKDKKAYKQRNEIKKIFDKDKLGYSA